MFRRERSTDIAVIALDLCLLGIGAIMPPGAQFLGTVFLSVGALLLVVWTGWRFWPNFQRAFAAFREADITDDACDEPLRGTAGGGGGATLRVLPDKSLQAFGGGGGGGAEGGRGGDGGGIGWTPEGAVKVDGGRGGDVGVGNVTVTSHNQSGGITALTVNQAPEPELRVGRSTSERVGDEFRITIPLEVVAPYPPADLYVEIHAPGARDLELVARGVSMHRSGNRTNMAFHELQSPYGHITARVFARTDKVDLRYQFG